MALMTGSEFKEMIKKVEAAGVDIVKDDFVLVIGKEVELFQVWSPIEIIVDEQCPAEAAYLLKRYHIAEEPSND